MESITFRSVDFEERNKAMAIAPTLGEYYHVLASDEKRPEEERTRWHLRVLSYKERAEVEREGLALFSKIRIAFGYCLLGWDNYKDANGEEFQIKEGVRGGKRELPDSVMDRLAPVSAELYIHIVNTFTIPEDEQKNC
jgi:hypothetical protein